MKYIIPARWRSSGFPFKNRILMGYTFQLLTRVAKPCDVIVYTDDNVIAATAAAYGYQCVERPAELSTGTEGIKDVLKDVVTQCSIDDDMMLLYLTHPYRTHKEIHDVTKYYRDNSLKSLVCLEPIDVHPYQCMRKEGTTWIKFIDQDVDRRQSYPGVMKLTHYIYICHSTELSTLDKVLCNKDTGYFELYTPVVDIDVKEDLWP